MLDEGSRDGFGFFGVTAMIMWKLDKKNYFSS